MSTAMEDDVEVVAIPEVQNFYLDFLCLSLFRAGVMVLKTTGRY